MAKRSRHCTDARHRLAAFAGTCMPASAAKAAGAGFFVWMLFAFTGMTPERCGEASSPPVYDARARSGHSWRSRTLFFPPRFEAGAAVGLRPSLLPLASGRG